MAKKKRLGQEGAGFCRARGAQAATGKRSAAAYRAKVRMYRQGLGDCFLISLPRNDGGSRPFYVMIDCGVVLGTPDPGTIMKQVMDNIVEVTGGQIDILVATHEHWDHLSGFVQAAESFDKLKVGQVWLAWTEDETDELTQKIRKTRTRRLPRCAWG